MGLLDELLGQLTAPPGRGAEATQPRARAAGAPGMDMSQIMMALLPVVIGMLGSRQRGRSAGLGPSAGAGGLGDILGQMLGGASGGGNVLGGLLEQFQRAGFGEQSRSWVARGQNQPISPDAIDQVFGRGGIAEIARRAGVSEQDASRGLSQLMPEVVDHMTPNGELPDDDALRAGVESLARRLGVA